MDTRHIFPPTIIREEAGIDAKWYQSWGKNWTEEGFDFDRNMRNNMRWIDSKMDQNYDIYDIGLKPGGDRSPFYAGEAGRTANYSRLIPLPGF